MVPKAFRISQSNLVARCLSLQSCLHDDLHHDNYGMLGSRIIFENSFLGPSFKIMGEFCFISKYWEWTEDVLFHFDKALTSAGIADAVHASLVTYDCNKDVMRAFCEAWCPDTNTLQIGRAHV